jgi:RimJ/RimL family protein N-acetyltransferase
MSPPSSLPVGPTVEIRDADAPSTAPMDGRFVRLVPVEPVHATALFAASYGDETTEAMWTYLSYGPFADEVQMRTWLEGIAGSDDPRFFTVIDLATGDPVGVVSYLNIVASDRRIELGHIWYVPAAQRGRANTETAYLLMRRAFDELGYRRVEWKCDALNARSRAAAERLGFTFEGVFRQHMIVKGHNRDTAWFSITDTEWPARRDAIETWLAADDPGSISLRDLTAAR